jgi:hypothetical protein
MDENRYFNKIMISNELLQEMDELEMLYYMEIYINKINEWLKSKTIDIDSNISHKLIEEYTKSIDKLRSVKKN